MKLKHNKNIIKHRTIKKTKSKTQSKTNTNTNTNTKKQIGGTKDLTEFTITSKYSNEIFNQLNELSNNLDNYNKITLGVILNNFITDKNPELEQLTMLFNSLATNTTVTDLNFAHINIRDQGAKRLAEVLKNNNTLKSINIMGNMNPTDIGDSGAQALADALTQNESLEILNLRQNQITSIGANSFLKALENNKSLKILDLVNNKLDSNGKDKQLLTAIQNILAQKNDILSMFIEPSLEELSLSSLSSPSIDSNLNEANIEFIKTIIESKIDEIEIANNVKNNLQYNNEGYEEGNQKDKADDKIKHYFTPDPKYFQNLINNNYIAGMKKIETLTDPNNINVLISLHGETQTSLFKLLFNNKQGS